MSTHKYIRPDSYPKHPLLEVLHRDFPNIFPNPSLEQNEESIQIVKKFAWLPIWINRTRSFNSGTLIWLTYYKCIQQRKIIKSFYSGIYCEKWVTVKKYK